MFQCSYNSDSNSIPSMQWSSQVLNEATEKKPFVFFRKLCFKPFIQNIEKLWDGRSCLCSTKKSYFRMVHVTQARFQCEFPPQLSVIWSIFNVRHVAKEALRALRVWLDLIELILEPDRVYRYTLILPVIQTCLKMLDFMENFKSSLNERFFFPQPWEFSFWKRKCGRNYTIIRGN